MSEIQNQITKMLADKFGVKESEISLDTKFAEDLGADSLDTVELIMEMEKTFDLLISDQEAEGIVSVGDAVRLIESKKA